MRLKTLQRNKHWQINVPSSLTTLAPDTQLNTTLSTRVTPPRIRRWLMSAFILLTFILLGVVTWLSYLYQASTVSSQLEEDSSRAATQIRTQLLRDEQTLRLLLTQAAENTTQSAFRQRVESMMSERPDILRMQWWQVLPGQNSTLIVEVLSGAAPVELKKTNLLDAYSPLPSEAKLALETSRASGQSLFSQPYYLSLDASVGMESMDLWVPKISQSTVRHELRLTYSLMGILNEHVGSEIANNHDLALTLTDGSYLARRQLMQRAALGESFISIIDLPGVSLQLKTSNLKTLARFIPNFLTTLVFALGGVLVTTLIVLLQDVRKRLALQRALEHQNALRKAMEDSLVTGLRARDLQGRITYVNPAFCEMVNLSAQELIGRGPPMPYWAPEALQEYQARHEKLLAGAISKEGFETVFMRKNGERFPVIVFEAPLMDTHGKQTGWMSSILDATEQRHIETLARQQQEQLAAQARLATMGELSTSLSHELNQPLAAISSYATATLNMISSGIATPLDIQDGLTRISKQAQRAGQVIRSVHDFVRRKTPVREVIDLRTVLNSIYPLIDLQAKQNNVRINTKFGQFVPDVLVDRLMIEQVMLNLTRNAVDAMKSIPHDRRVLDINVTSHDNQGTAFTRFIVSDQGTGIDPEHAHDVFSAFFTTKSEGMGMGLAICRSVIEQAHGKLWHEPRADGLQGCVFIVELPSYVAANHDIAHE